MSAWGLPGEGSCLILPGSELVSSGIPRVEFEQLRSGDGFQGVAVHPDGRRQFSRFGLRSWLHGEPCIGMTSSVGWRTTSPRETGYPPIVGGGTRHDSQFSTLRDATRLPPLLLDFGLFALNWGS